MYDIEVGYEDLNDHDQGSIDPLIAVLGGKKEPTGKNRVHKRDAGKPLAGKSTLNRLDVTPVRSGKRSRYKKVTGDKHMVDSFFTKVFTLSDYLPRSVIVLDPDDTDDLRHGEQLGRFFHGYYKNYCYLPLYIFCGDYLLCDRLRPGDMDASTGSVKELACISHTIVSRCP